MSNLLTELRDRGLLHQVTNGLEEHLQERRKFYVGFDLTAPYLHIGSLLPLMVADAAMWNGHQVIVLLGGATTKTGDPTGRTTAREEMTLSEISNNRICIHQTIAKLLPDAEIVNNGDWYKDLELFDFFLRVGFLSVNKLMTRSSYELRPEMTFKEFSYPAMQGYDFWHLRIDKGVTVQIGGSDQMGNIVTGIEIIRHNTDSRGFGLTCPLLLDNNGNKIGKSARNGKILSPDRSDLEEMRGKLRELTYNDVKELALEKTS